MPCVHGSFTDYDHGVIVSQSLVLYTTMHHEHAAVGSFSPKVHGSAIEYTIAQYQEPIIGGEGVSNPTCFEDTNVSDEYLAQLDYYMEDVKYTGVVAQVK